MKDRHLSVKKPTASRIVFQIINFTLLAIYAILCIFPLLNILATSLSLPQFADAGEVFLLPKGLNFASYSYLFHDAGFFKSLGNSFLLILIGVPWNMLMTILMAYPLSRPKHKFKGRKIYIVILWVCILFSAGIVPEYILRTSLQLQDNIMVLILPGVPAFNVILLMNFFKEIPEELHEAAEMDGASEFKIMFKFYLPLSLPSLLTTALFTTVELWGAYLPGILYMSTTDLMPLQSYLRQINFDNFDINSAGLINRDLISQSTLSSSYLFVSVMPMLALYLILQRYFIKGISTGGGKE